MIKGGVEKAILGISNLPPHGFAVTVKTVGFGNDRYNAGGKDYAAVGASDVTYNTNTVGDGDPIPTMSPFVSLFLCKKK